jgi:hypothetical protein
MIDGLLKLQQNWQDDSLFSMLQTRRTLFVSIISLTFVVIVYIQVHAWL